MKRKTTLLAIAFASAAPAIVAPSLNAVKAQDAPAQTATAEYPDVPRGHWAYEAINRLSNAGIIEGLPDGNYRGQKAMTRYEFAVAIARLLDRIRVDPAVAFDNTENARRLTALEARPVPDITRAEVNDLIAALRREFADELARLGVRVDALENRVSNLENRVNAPARVTVTPSILHRTGTATYITQVPVRGSGIFAPVPVPGRSIVNGNRFSDGGTGLPNPPYRAFEDRDTRVANEKYAYTDFELRLTDRITDRLSVTGALRSLGSTREDSWTGEAQGTSAYIREAFAVADLSDRSFLGIKGLTGILGRQRTKIGQGLLYDNDLQPTDQIHGAFNLGPLAINAFIGSNNNQLLGSSIGAFNGSGNPYLTTGAVPNVGLSGDPRGIFNLGSRNAALSGAAIGLPGRPGAPAGPGVTPSFVADYPDDNEAAVRAGLNLFRIAGQPVSIGVTRLFDGVTNQQGDSIDLTVPLFNRTIGIEYVRQRQYAFGGDADTDPGAYNITVPLFRSRLLDLNYAYGKANDNFEYFVSSAANPFARTYAEALFDRPIALGAPMINGRFFNGNGRSAGVPLYATAKEAYDINGTLRILRRLPLDFRYFRGYGTALNGGGQINQLDLGTVFSVGSTFNVSPGLDLEFKYGNYNVYGPYPSIQYVRVGANVGF